MYLKFRQSDIGRHENTYKLESTVQKRHATYPIKPSFGRPCLDGQLSITTIFDEGG